MKIALLIILSIIVGITHDTFAQKNVYFEVLPGAAYVFPSKLKVYQEGYPVINFKAKYEIQPFKLPPYYSLRAGYEINKDLSLELELNHLKIYVVNNPPEIQRFWATHGYNLLWFNVLKSFGNIDLRAGIGPVIAHPENTVRNKKWPETGGLLNNGYYMNGLSSQISIQRRLYILEHIFINPEFKMDLSVSRLSVVDGYADMRIFALHGLVGIGLEL